MECVEAALKTSFRKDMAMKFSAQTLLEELTLSSFHVQNVGTCDDFFVDDLLDFSHKEALEEEEEEPEQHNDSSNQSHEICNPDFGFLPTTEPSVPVDDAADLEWLSQFVEDSFSEYSVVAVPAGTSPENPKSLVEKGPEPGSLVLAQPCFKTPVPARVRSKRTRTGVPVWPLGSPSFTESSSSSTTSSSSSSPSSPLLIYTNMTQIVGQGCLEASPPEKKEKKTAPKGEGPGAALVPPRRCSHCGVQKTPQWRTGPLGAKTLCNACGVRYKSGRLLPEYRPACSPTFSSELHSNHHRKVLEMRRNKEVAAGPETGLAPPSAAPSF